MYFIFVKGTIGGYGGITQMATIRPNYFRSIRRYYMVNASFLQLYLYFANFFWLLLKKELICNNILSLWGIKMNKILLALFQKIMQHVNKPSYYFKNQTGRYVKKN